MPRSRRLILLAVAALLAGAALRGLLAFAEAALEGRVRDRLVAEAAERGFALTVDRVRVRLPSRASLLGLALAGRGVTARLDRVDVRIAPFAKGTLGRLRRLDLGPLAAELPQGVSLAAAPSAWDVSLANGILSLAGRSGEGNLVLERRGASAFRVRLDRLDLTRLLKVRRDGAWVGDLGVVSGVLGVDPTPGGGRTVEASLLARNARLAAPPEDDAPGVSALGGAFDGEGSVTATFWGDARFLELSCVSGTAAGLRGRARGIFAFAPGDAWFDFELSVPRLELAPLLAASGLDLPSEEEDLGSAALEARVTGRDGRQTTVDVDPASPDFVPLDDVPALFVRGLLTSEDANFWGHAGLDLGEVPVAASINWVRGERARGASTITQQLAKNLFLTRERSYRRKLQEAALALLLEPALGKRRILEIYLNVIEWGPGIHGIGPAARHYFGKNPAELTPRESAFLVALIPGPVKYQASFASGVLSRGFSRLVNGVLYRLRSVDMLTDEELAAELAAPIRLRWTPPDAAGEEEPGADGGEAVAGADPFADGPPAPSDPAAESSRTPSGEPLPPPPTPLPLPTPKASAAVAPAPA